MSRYKLVIIDDEPLIRAGLAKIIPVIAPRWQIAGEADNGHSALALIEEAQPDLVITDIAMPVQDGVHMYTVLRNKHPRIRCIVLSGYTDFAYVKEMMRLGAEDYLVKPVQKHLLAEALSKAEDEISSASRETLRADEERQQLREFWLQQLVRGVQYSVVECEERLRRLDIPVESPAFVLIGMQPDFSNLQASHRSAYLYFIYKGAQELAGEKGYVFRGEEGDVLALFWGDGEQSLQQRAVAFSDEFVRFVRSTSPLQLSVGISGTFHMLFRISEAAVQSQLARQFRSSSGAEQAFTWAHSGARDEIKSAPAAHMPAIHPVQLARQFASLLQQANAQQLYTLLNQTFRHQAPSYAKLQELRHLYGLLVSRLEEHAIQNGTSLAEVEGSPFLALANGAESLGHLDEYTERLQRLTDNLLAFIAANRQKQDPHVIARIKRYIQANLGGDITLQSVAEHVHMNPTYLSELFKQSTGENFISYLISSRVEHAKKLLLNNGLRWYQITESVGYRSPDHLAKVFKEYVGMTPSEFRKSAET